MRSAMADNNSVPCFSSLGRFKGLRVGFLAKPQFVEGEVAGVWCDQAAWLLPGRRVEHVVCGLDGANHAA